jgi:peptidoglycan hydrolase-like protein with peptidoglycan-binding domain
MLDVMPDFESQNPQSFGWPRGDQADIVPYTYQAHDFPDGVARGTEPLWTRALDLICAQPGFTLPDPRPSVGGCWGFSPRVKTSGNGWSFHAYGLALDIAAPWNPYGVYIPTASVHRMPVNTSALVRPLGMLWGGDFTGLRDWMHIELHLYPAEVAALVANLPRGPVHTEKTLHAFPLPAGYYYGPYTGPTESISGLGRGDQQYRPGLALAQRKLGVAGDGIYGPITRNATRVWQAAHQLTIDGLIGPATWRSLFGA